MLADEQYGTTASERSQGVGRQGVWDFASLSP